MKIANALGFALAASLLWGAHVSAAKAGEVQNYAPVTQQRLDNPSPNNWLIYRRTYNGHGYSPLNQINTENVKDLVPVWLFSTGVVEGHESAPMINNGVMFVTTPQDHVLALNAANGTLIWEYKPKLPAGLFQLHPTNRGVALWGDKVFLATVDSRLIALDAKTGKVAWQEKIGDYKRGMYSTLAPLVVKGIVMVGTSGGEFGVRCYIKGFDAKTGKVLWTTYTIPGPGQPGHNTWKTAAWKTGGGSVWMTGNYDPKTDVAYWGVGNPAPWPGMLHEGDSLYTTSTIAIKPETGKIIAHFQYTPNDSWDWDELRAPILVHDLKVDGKTLNNGLVHAARDGYIWILDATNNGNGIKFVSATPFVYNNAIKSINPTTGRPTYDPAHTPTVGKLITFCPSLWGGDDWAADSYDEQTHLLYIPATNNMCGEYKGVNKPLIPGQLWLGAELDSLNLLPRGDHIGELQAWNLETGKKVWQWEYPTQLFGSSLLTTGGGLLFVGGTNDRMFRAFDAKSGKLLWKIPTNSGITAPAVAYTVNGTEYIAVESGWGVDAQRIQDALSKTKLKLDPNAVPQGGVIWVFALRHGKGM